VRQNKKYCSKYSFFQYKNRRLKRVLIVLLSSTLQKSTLVLFSSKLLFSKQYIVLFHYCFKNTQFQYYFNSLLVLNSILLLQYVHLSVRARIYIEGLTVPPSPEWCHRWGACVTCSPRFLAGPCRSRQRFAGPDPGGWVHEEGRQPGGSTGLSACKGDE
jgi:hypothetical protein